MRKFNGIPKESFHLFLKECEWRFNNSDPKEQLNQLNQWVKKELTWLSRAVLKKFLALVNLRPPLKWVYSNTQIESPATEHKAALPFTKNNAQKFQRIFICSS
jgi:uncharacterized membrane protein